MPENGDDGFFPTSGNELVCFSLPSCNVNADYQHNITSDCCVETRSG